VLSPCFAARIVAGNAEAEMAECAMDGNPSAMVGLYNLNPADPLA
jgi:hypothetical protein